MTRAQRLTTAVAAIALLFAGAAGALLMAERDGNPGPRTALAQEQPEERGINVDGQGEISVTPDVANIMLGIEVEGTDLERIREDSDDRMNDVVDALLDMGFKEGDLQTVTYDIQVVDEPDEPVREVEGSDIEEKSEIEESDVEEDAEEEAAEIDEDTDEAAVDDEDVAEQTFRIVQMLQVRVSDIDSAGEVIDTALDSGANRVAGVSFEAEDRDDAIREARELAVEDARQKAEHLAELTGVEVGEPLWIDERSPSGPPERMEEVAMEMDDAADGAMPRIEPGEQTISVNVDIVYAIE